jgi:hypothetical protein
MQIQALDSRRDVGERADDAVAILDISSSHQPVFARVIAARFNTIVS